MRKWTFGLLVGVVMGVSSVLFMGAMDNSKPEKNADWNSLKIVTYPNGVTGFFNPATGKLYLYLSNYENCYAVYQLKNLGDPLVKTAP